MRSVAFHTLGCKVNIYETEAMRQALLREAVSRLRQTGPEHRLRENVAQARQLRLRLNAAAPRLLTPLRQRLAMCAYRLDAAADRQLGQAEQKLARDRARLEAMNPARVLERGYALVTAGSRVVTRAADAPAQMTLRFADGNVDVAKREAGGDQPPI